MVDNADQAASLAEALRDTLERGARLDPSLEAVMSKPAIKAWAALRRRHVRVHWAQLHDRLTPAELAGLGVRWSSAIRERLSTPTTKGVDGVEQVPVTPMLDELLEGLGSEARYLSRERFVHKLNALLRTADDLAVMAMSELTLALSAKIPSPRFERRAQRKRTGGLRWLHVPSKVLARVQQLFARELAPCMPGSRWSTAFDRHRSTPTHARIHAGARAAVIVDIHDFFGSISPAHLSWMTRAARVEEDETESQNVPRLPHSPLPVFFAKNDPLTSLFFATDESRTLPFLPQGAPSSPMLANLAAAPLDRIIDGQVRELSRELCTPIRYSRYADDLVLSTAVPSHEFHERARKILIDAVQTMGWQASPQKIRHWSALRGGPLVLCGINVPDQRSGVLSLPREIGRRLRAARHQAIVGQATPSVSGMLAYGYAVTGHHDLICILPGKTRTMVCKLAELVAPKSVEAFVAAWCRMPQSA